MKKLIFSLLILSPFISKAQMIDTLAQRKMSAAAVEFNKYVSQNQVGTGFIIAGALISTVKAVNGYGTSESDAAYVIGGGFMVAGYIIKEVSLSHISNAAIIFQGNGIAIPFGNKRRY